jgi:predicted N-acyltransferase
LRGYGQHFLLSKDLAGDDRQHVTAILFKALEREAASLKLSITFNNVMEQEHELTQMLEYQSYGKTVNFPLNYLDIQWRNHDEYLKFLSKRKLRSEVNKNCKEGVVITQLETTGSCQHRLHQLLNENHVKYNGKPLPMRKDFSSLCKKYLGSEAIVYIAVKEGAIIGTAFLFHRQSIAYLIDVGVDHATAGNDFTYFNLTYYRPTADAIAMGIKRTYYGTMMYTMKSRRGCATTPTYLYHKPRFPLLQMAAGPLFAIHRRFKSWFINRFYQCPVNTYPSSPRCSR